MEFWGMEVPSGKRIFCDPGEESYVHVSQAALGENKSGKGNDAVVLKVKVGNTEVVVGTLSQGRCDQTPLDLIFDKEFVLSHNGTSSSVYFCGYKTDAVKDDEGFDDDEFSESEEDTAIQIQRIAKENGKPGAKAVKADVQAIKPPIKETVQNDEAPSVKAKSKQMHKTMKQQAGKGKPQSVQDDEDEDDEEEDDDEEDGDDEQDVEAPVRKAKPSTAYKMLNQDDDDDDDEEEDDDEDDEMLDESLEDDDLDAEEEDDSDEDDSDEDVSEEEQPMSTGKKRHLDGVKFEGSEKKSKLIIPVGAGKQGGKIEAKTPLTPTPTPKQQQQSAKKDASAKKTPGKENGSKVVTPSSGKKLGQFFCQPCSKSFQTESALTQHNSAKHK